LKKCSSLFALDIPLPEEHFGQIHNEAFRNFIRQTGSFIVLDNSKGRGLKEPKEALMQKIDTLIGYGLCDITLCGGFGPDELHTYFEIRRYYQLNFSIDAETHLRTEGRFDLLKIKRYLLQLVRFDDPNEEGIEQTKKFLEEHRSVEGDSVKIGDHHFLIHPQVFHAGHFPSSQWFTKELCPLLATDSDFCEVGCGSGVISCLTALSHTTLQVTATDINPYASENTRINVERLGLHPRFAIFTGDVLDGITPQKQFDTIFWALPFGFLDPGREITLEEAQVFDPGYRAIGKLLQSAPQHLKPGGRLLLGFSSALGNYPLLKSLAEEVKASIQVIAKTIIQEEVPLPFEILELSYQTIEDDSLLTIGEI
jgi:precorrin-6B methylase 2